MKHLLKLLLLYTLTFLGSNQLKAQEIDSMPEGEIFSFAEEMPEFSGGTEKLFEFIAANLKYPEFAYQNGVQGKVLVTFVIGKNGKLYNIKTFGKGMYPDMEAEAIRLVKSMPPWTQNGEKVNVRFNIPISFKL